VLRRGNYLCICFRTGSGLSKLSALARRAGSGSKNTLKTVNLPFLLINHAVPTF
jgi:hypothetical protein